MQLLRIPPAPEMKADKAGAFLHKVLKMHAHRRVLDRRLLDLRRTIDTTQHTISTLRARVKTVAADRTCTVTFSV
jgi:hypothetical protein